MYIRILGSKSIDSQNNFPTVGMSKTRGQVQRANLEREVQDKFFFTRDMVGAWNALPKVVVQANMIVTFARVVDRDLDIQGMDRV